jgi:hypothetical protein
MAWQGRDRTHLGAVPLAEAHGIGAVRVVEAAREGQDVAGVVGTGEAAHGGGAGGEAQLHNVGVGGTGA